MESLTAKIIAISLELPEFYVLFFFFLNDCPERGANCITMPTDSPQSRCEFSFRTLPQTGTTEHQRKGLNLTGVCAFQRQTASLDSKKWESTQTFNNTLKSNTDVDYTFKVAGLGSTRFAFKFHH